MVDSFQLPNHFGNPNQQNQPQKLTRQPASSIESFKDQGRAATVGLGNSFMEQILGTPQSNNQASLPYPQPLGAQANPNLIPQMPPPNFNFQEFLNRRELQIRQQERNLSQQQRRQETVLFNRKEESAKKEIEMIKEEIKKIIKTSQGISSELMAAEQTVMTTTVEAGTYQINFFQRIRSLLALARKHLSESGHWLELFNSRKKQRSFYWGQVKKSGTKFMLSQERTLATQAG